MTFNLQAPRITPTTELEERIADMAPWFHNIRLPGGEQTAPNHPLGDFPRYKWEEIAPFIPADLKGAVALDIGCNAGFYSLELARRGARVFAIDHDERYLRQARWVARQWRLEHAIEHRRLDIWQLARDRPDLPDAYDLVLFMGVLYHLRHPLLGLDIAAYRTGGTMVFQSLTTGDDQIMQTPPDLPLEERAVLSRPWWPRMSFIERSFASDQTNWWVANAACCEAMLRSVRLEIVARPGQETYICRRDPTVPRRRPPEIESLLGS